MSTEVKTSQLSSIDTIVLSSVYFVALDETNTIQTSSGSTIEIPGDDMALAFWGLSANYISNSNLSFVSSLSAGWQSTYTTTSTNSATWQEEVYTPQTYYVEYHGNNSTAEGGKPSKPYATATAAYAAGVTAGQKFILHIGVGSYALDLSSTLSPLLKGINGVGCGDNVDEFASTLSITAIGGSSYNSNGVNGKAITLNINNIAISVDTSGGAVEVYDGGTYTAGSGGAIDITGPGRVFSVKSNGGAGTISGMGGTVQGGDAGTIILKNINGYACELSVLGGDSASTDLTPPNGNPGNIYLDNCDMREVYPTGSSTGTIFAGRSSVTNSAIGIGTNYGGNALY